MIDQEYLNKVIENYINLNFDWDLQINCTNFYEKYLYNTTIRLKNSFDFYQHHRNAYADYLIALRDYLLVFNTMLNIKNLPFEHLNEFGLFMNDNVLGANFDFPDYVNEKFAKDVYMSNFEYKETEFEENLDSNTYVKYLTGFDEFRSLSQKLAVYGALNAPDGYTTLISLPTGGGKSLVTQTLAYQKEGLTIVVVPTISLAIDQERVSKKIIKISKENEIFSYSSGVNITPILTAIKNKTAKLLFISPEALMLNESFKEIIREANKNKYLNNIIIDEAHIVADWGTLFRVDYQCLESWIYQLGLENPKIRTFLLSATFERNCTKLLKNLFCRNNNWIEIRCDSLRREPRYMLVKSKNFFEKRRKLIELIRKLPHPLIVYVSSPYEAEQLIDSLLLSGFKNVKTFTGKTTSSKRKSIIDKWVEDQFEIMIATSAFGMGVDKSDVRTVIHAYLPPNANEYYQELGRGGRDRLPCLSVMCIDTKEDQNSAFQRINKRVMTSEKIYKRWFSLYNDKRSIRKKDKIIINTSIKPDYMINDDDFSEDSIYFGNADINWNVYVLLFLRRNNLLKIESVTYEKGIYYFELYDLNKNLLIDKKDDDEFLDFIEQYRSKEYNDYKSGLEILKRSIKSECHVCWSEMFYEVYDYIDEYCAGCPNHEYIIEDSEKFPLKKPINNPVLKCSEEMEQIFLNSKDVIFYYGNQEIKQKLLKSLVEKECNIILSEDFNFNELNTEQKKLNYLILNRKSLVKMMDKRNDYYLSGTMIVLYPEDIENETRYIKTIFNKRKKLGQLKIIHLLKDDVYLSFYGKKFSELVDGPVMNNNRVFK